MPLRVTMLGSGTSVGAGTSERRQNLFALDSFVERYGLENAVQGPDS
jgi:hypothetical protein